MSLLINEDERPRTERPIYWTGKVAIGLRAGEQRAPHAANPDETAVQDIVRGLRPSRVTESGHRIGVPAACFFAAVVLLYVLVVRS